MATIAQVRRCFSDIRRVWGGDRRKVFAICEFNDGTFPNPPPVRWSVAGDPVRGSKQAAPDGNNHAEPAVYRSIDTIIGNWSSSQNREAAQTTEFTITIKYSPCPPCATTWLESIAQRLRADFQGIELKLYYLALYTGYDSVIPGYGQEGVRLAQQTDRFNIVEPWENVVPEWRAVRREQSIGALI